MLQMQVHIEKTESYSEKFEATIACRSTGPPEVIEKPYQIDEKLQPSLKLKQSATHILYKVMLQQ